MANEEFKRLSLTINIRIAQNLQKLLEARNYSVKRFVEVIEEEKLFCSRQHFANMLNKPTEKGVPFSVVLLCCNFFGITIANLISENFDPYERIELNSDIYKVYLEIEKLLDKSKDDCKDKMNASNFMPNHFNMSFEESSAIFTDPKEVLFRGYLRDYYCYYYPTNSEVNKNSEKIFCGSLNLSKCNNDCKATFIINNERYQKEYIGQAFISGISKNLHAIMYEKQMGEFCFLSIRYVPLNEGEPFCRIAEVLSSSSLDEERRPTVLRMFLSSESIADEHVHIVQSAIRLNYSKIAVSNTALENVAAMSETYEKIVNSIKHESEAESMYIFSERDDIYRITQSITKDHEKTLEFIAHLRNASYSFKYNKVSDKADKNIKELLMKKGYYQ